MLKGYVRHSIITNVEDTLKQVRNVILQGGDSIKLNGVEVHINRKKLRVYTEKGCRCFCCGDTASYIAIEKSKFSGNRWIMHLYINKDGIKEKLLTRDHIYPVSKGGPGCVNNLQPMCARCNAKKSDNMFIDKKILKTVNF